MMGMWYACMYTCVLMRGGACVQVCLCMCHSHAQTVMHTFTVCEHLYPPPWEDRCNHGRILKTLLTSSLSTHFKSRLQRRQGPATSTVLGRAWAQCRPKSQPAVSWLTQGSIRGRGEPQRTGENQVRRGLTTSAKAPELTTTLRVLAVPTHRTSGQTHRAS